MAPAPAMVSHAAQSTAPENGSNDPSKTTLTTIGATLSVVVVVVAIAGAVFRWWIKRRRQQRNGQPPGLLSEEADIYGVQGLGDGDKETISGAHDGPSGSRPDNMKSTAYAPAELAERGDPQHLDSIEIIPLRSELYGGGPTIKLKEDWRWDRARA